MDGSRRPRRPRESRTESKGRRVGDTCSATPAPRKAAKRRRQAEQDPRTGAEPAAVPGAPCPAPARAPEAAQGPRTPSTQRMQMVVVVLEPGTALELRLGAEVLVLAPHAALQLTLGNLALVVVPARVLSSSEALWFPAHARWLWPGPTQAAWAINVQDGSLCAQRAEPSGAPPAPEDGEARRGCRPPAGPWAGGVPGLSPSSPHTLLLQALRGAPARQGCGLPPEPRAGLRPLPAEFSLDLRGLGPPPSSELRPLPPSPSPSPPPRSCRAPPRRRPPAKARRRLFRGD
ncbi:proline-rich protein 23D1-like [Equus caballus]|uniref:proline-rich protein 23D1-like n=1 Tax=Equus caballus TaxID=9796 RepID=UPI0038B32B92